MKKRLALALLAACFALPAAAADSASKPALPQAAISPQAEKMKSCAAEYKGKGIPKVEYRKFMGVCLKKDYTPGSYQPGMAATTPPAMAPTPAAVKAPSAPQPSAKPMNAAAGTKLTEQQEKMKSCNAKAKDLSSDERKVFMKGCLGKQ